jgi:antitoxin CptB
MPDEMNRLKWLCRRGTKELDFILNRYLSKHYAIADADEQMVFKQLLELEDPELNDKLVGTAPISNEKERALLLKLLND